MSKLTYQQRGNPSTRIPVSQKRTTGGQVLEDNRIAFNATASLSAMKKTNPLTEMSYSSPAMTTQRNIVGSVNTSPYMTAQRQQLDNLTGGSTRQLKEEPLSGNFESAQRIETSAPPNNTGLPDNLKNGIESLSGLSMDNVKVHYNSAKPQQLNALAYAQGTDIHVGPGQEQHLPHEAWHVVQQAQGRVRPTMQAKGIKINDAQELEQEADLMGEKAIQMVETAHYARKKNSLSFFDADKQEMNSNKKPITLIEAKPLAKQLNKNIIQKVSMAEVDAEIKNKEVLRNWIIFQMFEDKASTPEELLAEHTLSEVKETIAVWSQGGNAAYLKKQAALFEGVVREGKMKQLLLTREQIEILEKTLQESGKEIEISSYITLAAIKNLTFSQIMEMVDINKKATDQGFPPIFHNKNLWQEFCSLVNGAVKATGLPFTEIVLQGSAVRKNEPKDIDIGVLVNPEQLDIFFTIENLITNVISMVGTEKEKSDEKNRNANKDKSINKGKIEARYFPATSIFLDKRTIIQEWLKSNLNMDEAIQLSIIPLGSRFDIKPNMKISN